MIKLDDSANRLDGLLRRIDPKAQALLTGLTRNSQDLHGATTALHDYIHALHHRGLIRALFGGGVGGEPRPRPEDLRTAAGTREPRKERKVAER